MYARSRSPRNRLAAAGAVSPGERLLPRRPEELAVHADQQPGGDPRVARVDAELALDRRGQHLREVRHHLELLGLQRGRLLDDPREGREARAGEPRALADLKPPERSEDRLVRRSAADRLDDRGLTLGDLVEEQILLRREVVVDGLLRHVRRRGDVGNGHPVEAALDEEPHRLVGELAAHVQLLGLAQAHDRSVTSRYCC